MSQPGSSTTARLLGVIAGLAAALGLYFYSAQKAQTPTAPVVPAVAEAPAAAKEKAVAQLMALPELKAWSALLEKNSGGKLHGAVVEYDPAPKIVGGKPYWQLSFVENGAAAAHSWESFLVAQDGSAILVEDFNTDKQMTLEQWRRDKRPMERTSADAGY